MKSRSHTISEQERQHLFEECRRNHVPVPIDWAPIGARAAQGTVSHIGVQLKDVDTDRHPNWFAVEASRNHFLPLFESWRLLRFGRGIPASLAEPILDALLITSRRRHAIRCHLQLFDWDAGHREELRRLALGAGFRPSPRPESYARTVLIDLRHPTEDDLFATLGATARRHVRAVRKNHLTVEPLTDPGLADALAALEEETRQRTGGRYVLQNWDRWLASAASHPDDVRISALRDPRADMRILAFALGVSHGDHVEYRAAASTRLEGYRVPLAYGPAWDLIQWAYRSGHGMFDFGGITDGDSGLASISAFKKRFSNNVVRVSEELILEPRPLVARLARWLSAARRRLPGMS